MLASRDGAELFVSEVQEKTLKREPLSRLWAEHAAQARESGRLAHEALYREQAEVGNAGAARPVADDHG